jgi:hypothetical protein
MYLEYIYNRIFNIINFLHLLLKRENYDWISNPRADKTRKNSRRIVEYGFGMLLSFNNVIIIINTYIPEPSSVLAIRCILLHLALRLPLIYVLVAVKKYSFSVGFTWTATFVLAVNNKNKSRYFSFSSVDISCRFAAISKFLFSIFSPFSYSSFPLHNVMSTLNSILGFIRAVL